MVACVMGLICGCASIAPALPVTPAIHWPPPPERPVFEFVGVYSSSEVFSQKNQAGLFANFLSRDGITLTNPYGIFSDGNGKVYVSEKNKGTLVLFDFGARRVSYLEPENGVLFSNPHDMTIDAEGNMYVTDASKKRVVVLGPDGSFLRSMGNEKIFERPVHVAVHDKAGRVYVSDARRHNISVFSLAGEFRFSFGSMGKKEGQFAMPYGVAVGPDENIYVADMLNARIQVFDQDGRFLRAIANTPDSGLELEFPRDIGFTSDGSLHIIDIKRALLVTCTKEGVRRFVIGDERPSANPLGFSSPTAIFVDKHDRVYIADQINNRFTVWQYLSEAYRAKAALQ